MDIFKFVNSTAVADHLKSIDYSFSALEKAFLVYQSDKATLKEKHEAYSEIIATETDISIEKRPNTEAYPSLFDFLRRYMQIENEIIDEFYHTENAVYRFRYLCGKDTGYCENYETVYPTLEQCTAAFRAEIEDFDFDVELRFFEQRMDSLEEIGKYIEIKFTPNGEILSVFVNRIDEESGDVLCAIDGMWFDFPTPFKRGDVVVKKHAYDLCNKYDPIVITSLSTWDKSEYVDNGYTERDCDLDSRERVYQYRKRNGDTSDLNVCGYFACTDGSFYYEVDYGLLNYEYYAGPYTGGYRILKVLSDFEKGELSTDALVSLAQHIVNEERVRDEVKYIHLNEEYLKKIGIL